MFSSQGSSVEQKSDCEQRWGQEGTLSEALSKARERFQGCPREENLARACWNFRRLRQEKVGAEKLRSLLGGS